MYDILELNVHKKSPLIPYLTMRHNQRNAKPRQLLSG